MTHTTVRFQYDTARFELYLDKLTGLPAPNIRKLFKLMLSESWNNQAAIDAVEAFLPAQIEESKEAWRHGGRHPLISKTVGGLYRTSGAKRAVPSWPKTTGSIKP